MVVASTIGRPAARWAANAVSANGCTMRTQFIGDAGGRGDDCRLWASLGQGDRLAGERHRWQRLADRVEEAVEQLLAGDRVGPDETRRAHRAGEHLTGGATQQRPIEVEERSSTRRCHRIRLRTPIAGPACGPGPKNGKDPDGGSGSLNLGIPPIGGSDGGLPFEWNMGGVLTAICL